MTMSSCSLQVDAQALLVMSLYLQVSFPRAVHQHIAASSTARAYNTCHGRRSDQRCGSI